MDQLTGIDMAALVQASFAAGVCVGVLVAALVVFSAVMRRGR